MKPPHPFVSFTRFFLSLAAVALCSRAVAAEPALRPFDIPAGDAIATLKQFAVQSEARLLYSVEAVKGVKTNAIKGDLTPREALNRLTSGSVLQVTENTADGALALTRGSDDRPNAPRAAPVAGARPKPEVTARPADSTETIVELSPFQVSAEEETGYRATSTLAGSRLKTDLKDIGASISVVTNEMMSDLGAVNLEDILVFTAGTEVGGMSGNFLGAGLDQAGSNNDARTNPSDNNRVRGLAKVTNTRDYFVSEIPFNQYNSTALTISRGPNAILAGVGSPGGVIDRGLATAIFKDRNEVTGRIGSNGAHRETVDINKVIIPNKLSLRLVMLNEDLEYNQSPANMKDQRLFGAMTLKLHKGRRGALLGDTILRGNYETGTVKGTPPNPLPPINSFASYWIDNQPRFNAVTNVYTDRNGTVLPAANLTHTNAFFKNYTVFYNQPDQLAAQIGYGAPGFTNVQGMQGTINAVAGSIVPVNRTYQATASLRRFASGIYFARMADADRPTFDFRENLLTGAFDFVQHKFHATNARLEQLFLDGRAGVELAFDSQNYDRRNNIPFSGSDATVLIDITQVHSNGQTNPNYGRPFIVTQDINGLQNYASSNRGWRATAFYNHNFSKSGTLLGRILGSHTLTGLATSTTTETINQAFNSPWLTDDKALNLDTLLANPGLFARNARGMIYVGPSAAGTASSTDIKFSPVTARLPSPGETFNISLFNPTTRAFQVSPLTIGQIMKSAGKRKGTLDSQAVSLQSYWLDRHLISLVGLRRDSDVNYTASNPTILPDGNVDLATLVLPSAASSKNIQTSPSFSLVGVLPEKLRSWLPFDSTVRGYWNTSKNFTPSGQRRNLFNQEIGAPAGKTKEYGIMLTSFRGKLDVRLNWFETTAQNASDNTLSAGAAIGQTYTIIDYLLAADANNLATRDWGYSSYSNFTAAALDQFKALPAGLRIGEAYNFNPRLVPGANGTYTLQRENITNAAVTTDYVAKGLELEAVLNVTKNWRMAFNASKTETVKSKTGADVRAYVDEYLGNLQRINPQLLTGSRQPGQATDPWLGAFRGAVVIPLEVAERKAGTAAPELVKWRWNLVNRYDFSARVLKGLFVGGALRWQDRAVVGYPYITDTNGQLIADLAKPYFGQTDFRGDAFIGFKGAQFFGRKLKWSVQLNVRNVIGDDGLILASVNPDGTPAAVRIPPEKAWLLSSTFQF